MEEGREWKRGGNGSGGGMDDRKKNIPFRRKPESHSRDSENFPRSGTLQWSPVGECGFAAEIPAFAGMEVIVAVPPPPHSRESGNLPVKRGGQRTHRTVFLQLESREIPAFAGMEGEAGMERGAGMGMLLCVRRLSVIPAKTEIHTAKIFSAKWKFCVF